MIEELNKLIENSIEISGLKIDLIDYDKELSDEELVIEECYYVEDKEDPLFMIGKLEVINVGSSEGNTRGRCIYKITSIDNILEENVSWCYRSDDGSRSIKLATPEENLWLEECIEKDKFINKMEFNRNKRV